MESCLNERSNHIQTYQHAEQLVVQKNRVVIAEYLLDVKPSNVESHKFVARVLYECLVKCARERGFEDLAEVGTCS